MDDPRTGHPRVLGIDPDDFLDWLESTVPTDISEEAGEDAADRRSRLADAVDELDGILLTAIEEIAKAEQQEMSPARAERASGATLEHHLQCGCGRTGSVARESFRPARARDCRNRLS
jgi:hypothetical protein